MYALGKLAGTDTRWDVISQSVDDRTDSERGTASAATSSASSDPELVAGGTKRLFKSRYSSVSRFIGKTESEEEQRSLDALNDIDANMDEEAFKMLLEGGLDRSLAAHIAHLFVRDPLVIFDDAIVLDDKIAMVRQCDTVQLESIELDNSSMPSSPCHIKLPQTLFPPPSHSCSYISIHIDRLPSEHI
jgi:glutamate--cysteine ligase catalytic subunit